MQSLIIFLFNEINVGCFEARPFDAHYNYIKDSRTGVNTNQ